MLKDIENVVIISEIRKNPKRETRKRREEEKILSYYLLEELIYSSVFLTISCPHCLIYSSEFLLEERSITKR